MSELLIVPHTERMRREHEAKTAETLALVRGIGNALSTPSESGMQPTVAEVLGRAVTDAMVGRAIDTRTSFMGAYHDPVSDKRFRFPDSEKTDQVRQFIAREKAREVLANGLSVAETMGDVNIWHQLIENDEFIGFGKEPIRDELLPFLPMPNASQVIETIVKVGGRNKKFLGNMATKWWRLYDRRNHDIKTPRELENLATHVMEVSRGRLGAKTDFRLRDLGKEFDSLEAPQKFFAASLQRKSDEAYALPETEFQILGLLKYREVTAKSGWYFEGLNRHMADVFGQQIASRLRADTAAAYREASYSLLGKTLEFAGESLPVAKKVAQETALNLNGRRKQRVSAQTERVVSMANNLGLRQYISNHVQAEADRIATKSDVEVVLPYDAVDRILIVIEEMASRNGVDDMSLRAITGSAKCIRAVLGRLDNRLEEHLKRIA